MATILETINQVLTYENEPERRRQLLKNTFELTEEQVAALMQAIESIPEDYTQLVSVVEGLVASYGTLENTVEGLSENVGDITDDLENKADKTGTYENLTAGNALQLLATDYTEDQTPYLFRTSGGSADIGNREEDVIVGGSVAWNQQLPDKQTATYYGVSASYVNGILTLNGTVTTAGEIRMQITNTPIPTGRKILLHTAVKTIKLRVQGSYNYITEAFPVRILNMESNAMYDLVLGFTGLEVGTEINESFPVYMVDLTQMFGSAVADAAYSKEQASAGSGVAWLKSMGFFVKDYYAYNPGGMESVRGLLAHEMVGFNQWDGNYTSGKWINDFDGSITNANGYNLTDYIPVIPNTVYYHSVAGSSRSLYYDADKEVINTGAWAVGGSAGTFTIPSNARYIRFTLTDANINAFVLNLHWSGYLDGEYKPYVKHTYPLDSTLTLRGIPKLDASNQLYFDGDEYSSDGTVTRRYDVVDLGTLNWIELTQEEWRCFQTIISGKLNGVYNMIMPNYDVKSGYGSNNTADKVAWGNATNTNVYIRDTTYTDAATFKTAMSGVMLIYEVATPTTESATPYASPQIVDDFGTEEYVIDSDVAVPVPVGHVTRYPANLRDKLQHLPDLSSDGDGYYLIQQSGTDMILVAFRIPRAPETDGTYTLKCTVSGGSPLYEWESVT